MIGLGNSLWWFIVWTSTGIMYPILFIHACMSLEALVSTGSRSLRRSTSSKRSVQWPQAGRRMRAVHERVGKIWDPDTITHLICNGFRKAVRRTCFWFGVSIPWHEDLVKWSQIAELHKDIEHLFHWTLRERWLFFSTSEWLQKQLPCNQPPILLYAGRARGN